VDREQGLQVPEVREDQVGGIAAGIGRGGQVGDLSMCVMEVLTDRQSTARLQDLSARIKLVCAAGVGQNLLSMARIAANSIHCRLAASAAPSSPPPATPPRPARPRPSSSRPRPSRPSEPTAPPRSHACAAPAAAPPSGTSSAAPRYPPPSSSGSHFIPRRVTSLGRFTESPVGIAGGAFAVLARRGAGLRRVADRRGCSLVGRRQSTRARRRTQTGAL
jgi:hypothetical protein